MAKVFLTEPINNKGLDLLIEHGFQNVNGTAIDEESVCREAKDCDGILSRNAIISAKVMDSCPNLKVIAVHGVGVDIVDVKAATERKIQVTNAAESNQKSVAEYTIGLILMLAKNSAIYNTGLKAYDLKVRNTMGHNVAGRTLGIIGMGNIGTQVAHMASLGLGMKVVGYSRHISGIEQTSFGVLCGNLQEVIESADFLSLHLPGSPSTKHFIGEKELSFMKQSAYLINTGRGEVVDEKALIEALQTKRIKGAALDVFEGNLPQKDNPLLTMDNVIVTPHTAAFTVEALERMAYQSALGIVEVLENKPLSYPVNRLHDSFEDREEVTTVMDYFRYEFNLK